MFTKMADIPTFLKGEYKENWDYHEQTQQTLRDNIGPNGFVISPLTMVQVAIITGMNFQPVLQAGTMFFVTDYSPPTWAGISVAAVLGSSNATLVTFTTVPY